MRLWKSRTSGSDRYRGGKEDLVSRLRNDIPRVRNQGVHPEKDPARFSGYLCDLCNSPFAYTELKQCTLCGRWACSSCWTEKYYACNSCNGLITLLTMQDEGHK